MRPWRVIVAALGACVAFSCASILAIDDVSYGPGPADATNDLPSNMSADAMADVSDADSAATEAGALDAGDAAEASLCDASLASDTHNCGSCGHDCLYAACTNGRCQPLVFADGLAELSHFAIDRSNVYWSIGSLTGSISSCSIDGGACSSGGVLVAGAQSFPRQLTSDGQNLYWTANTSQYGTLNTCALDGGCAAQHIISHGSDSPHAFYSVVVVGQNVFWTTYLEPNDGGLGGGGVFSAMTQDHDVNGGTPIQQDASGVNELFTISAGPTGLFWTSSVTGLTTLPPFGTTVPKSLAAPTNLTGGSVSVVADGNYVYWTRDAQRTAGANGLFACPLSGCGGGLAMIAPMAFAIALDATHVYWTSEVPVDGGAANGVILRAPLCLASGCATPAVTETLATNQSHPYWIAVDDVGVYWANNVTFGGATTMPGQIMRLAK